MKTSHKMMLLASVLCLYPLVSNAAIRKINEYKQNAFTNEKIYGTNSGTSSTSCSDANYAKNHPEQCVCKKNGYSTTTGPTNDVDKNCFENPNGTTISNVTCYKWKNGNQTNTSFPYDQEKCKAKEGVSGTLGGSQTLLYDCDNGTATPHSWFSSCDCPSGYSEIKLLSTASKYFSYETITLPSKICIKEASITCKSSSHALLKKNGSDSTYSVYNTSTKQFMKGTNTTIALDGGKLVVNSKNLTLQPVFTFDEVFLMDDSKTYACVNKGKYYVSTKASGMKMFSTELDIQKDNTYGDYSSVCLELVSKAEILSNGCALNINGGSYPGYYHTRGCLEDWSLGNPGGSCVLSGSIFTAYDSNENKLLPGTQCFKTCTCSSANDKFEGGNLYGTVNDEGFSLGAGCLISCSSGYVEVYKGSTSGCGSFCPTDANATIPGDMSGFSNGETKYTYSLKKIAKGTGTLVCGTPVGCNISAGYISPTGCSTDSWCSWFNKN